MNYSHELTGKRAATRTAFVLISTSAAFILLESLVVARQQRAVCLAAFQACPSLLRVLGDEVHQSPQPLSHFVALAVIGILFVRCGWQRVFFIPAVGFVLIPYLIRSEPFSMGTGGWASAGLGVSTEAMLSLVPAAFLADRKVCRRTQREGAIWEEGASLALCVVGLVVLIWVRNTIDGTPIATSATVLLAESLVAGLALSDCTIWAFVGCLIVPLMLTEGSAGGWSLIAPGTWSGAQWYAGVALIGFSRRPLTRIIDALNSEPLFALFLLQALNIADAVLTSFGLHRRVVTEANPIARLIGMPAKIIVVGVAGWSLYRWRPRWLVVPVIALMAVLIYHVGGLVVNAH